MVLVAVDASEVIGFGEAMQAAPDLVQREMQIASREVLDIGVEVMQEFVPVDEGDLRDDVRILTGPDASGGTFGTDLIYAAQRNYGGTIRARNAPWLVFRTRDGNWVRTKQVTQTGSHYLERTDAALKPRAEAVYSAALARVWDRLMARGW